MVEKPDKAVRRARSGLLASNENVSALRVLQAALLMVKAESWESLGFQMQQVSSLNRLLVAEGRINAFIHCFVAVRRITSLYDLEAAVLENISYGQQQAVSVVPRDSPVLLGLAQRRAQAAAGVGHVCSCHLGSSMVHVSCNCSACNLLVFTACKILERSPSIAELYYTCEQGIR